jgi:ribosomal protein S18 acetylase RimI-like enzyme
MDKRPAFTPIIRKALPADAAAIGTVFQRSWLATYPNEEGGITRADIEALALDSAENTRRRAEKLAAQDERSFRLVAEVAGEVIAQCGFEHHPGYGYLRSLYVLPEHMSQGIGTSLLEKALDLMDYHGRIYLAVATYNRRAIRFYERFGFVVTQEGPAFAPSPFPNGTELPQIHMVRTKGI